MRNFGFEEGEVYISSVKDLAVNTPLLGSSSGPLVDVESQSQLGELNSQIERSILNKFSWGAGFGELFLSSQLLFYWTLTLGSSDGFRAQLDKLNFVPETVDSLLARTLLSYATYAAAVAVISGCLNLARKAWQEHKKPSDAYGEKFSEYKSTDDVNKLFRVTVADRESAVSNKQLALSTTMFLAFLVPNIIYCYTFRDIGNEATTLLPDYDLPPYKALNQNAGDIGFIMNAALNQWFSFAIIVMSIVGINTTSLTRKHFHKDGPASLSNRAKNVVKTLSISAVSSFAFFFLALDDGDRTKLYPPIMAALIPYCAFAVYGAVLNTEGSIGLLADLGRFWDWLNTMPKPIVDAHEKWNQYRGYVFGYLASNIKETFREMAYYTHCYNAFAHQNDLELPRPKENERAPFIPVNEEQRLKPAYTNAKLKERVISHIREMDAVAPDIDLDRQLLDIVLAERSRLDGERASETTRGDIWKHGRLRSTIAKPWALIGPAGLSVVLLSYYFLVNKKLNNRIYDGWFGLGLNENDAWARMLTVYLFYPFIKLVHDSGYKAMSNMFNGIEHTIVELYHSYQVARGNKQSSDFSYTDRFHPTNKKEVGLFVLGTFVFFAQVSAFLVTPSSAGTVLFLLDEKGYLNLATQSICFWFTALFNSFGIASFLSWGKQKVIESAFESDRWKLFCSQNTAKWKLFRKTDEFFESLDHPNGCNFEMQALTDTALNAKSLDQTNGCNFEMQALTI